MRPEGNQSWGRPELAPFPGFVEQNGHSVDGGLMDPLSAIGLWALSLVGIGALVYVARTEAHQQRKLSIDED
jgi:hypothetical protein